MRDSQKFSKLHESTGPQRMNFQVMAFHNSILLMLLVVLLQPVSAQVTGSELSKEWERSKTYTMAYLEAMPENQYGNKPTPEIRSFAAQFLHLADANYGLGSAALNMQSPYAVGELEKSSDKSKQNVIKLVAASYDFIIEHLHEMSDTELNETIQMIGKFEMSSATAIGKVFEHQVHHRGQTTVYLRLAGVTPPEEQLF